MLYFSLLCCVTRKSTGPHHQLIPSLPCPQPPIKLIFLYTPLLFFFLVLLRPLRLRLLLILLFLVNVQLQHNPQFVQ